MNFLNDPAYADDDNFKYEEVVLEPDEEDFDDLAAAFSSINNGNKNNELLLSQTSMTQVRPSVVDDFIRNFLIKAGMKRTLDSFNVEWYELQSKGKLPSELSVAVPDIYLRNEELDQTARQLREEVERMREVANRAQATWDKFRKERDFHRMHHKRVVQEKNKLVDDIRRLRNHMRAYEPALEELKRKHDVALSERMLMKLAKERLSSKVKVLEVQVANLSQPAKEEVSPETKKKTRPRKMVAVYPPDDPGANPFNSVEFDAPNFGMYSSKKTFKGHVNSVSAVAFHPKKSVFATASDDATWRLWTTDCELVMSGEGHESWLSGLHFHPNGTHLATSSGDNTVKLWDFTTAKCSHTITDHTQAVWGCEFHRGGDFLASCSMDHTARIWDMIAGKNCMTLRGHVDSVNAVCWQPYTANVVTASGDKTLSVWDGRTSQCVQTLYGHGNSVNHVAMSKRGDVIVSTDADGVLKVWDIRMVAELGTIDGGQYPINKIALDRGGHRAVCACDDGLVKVFDIHSFSKVAELGGHDGAVQCIALNATDDCFVTGASDCTYKIWSL